MQHTFTLEETFGCSTCATLNGDELGPDIRPVEFQEALHGIKMPAMNNDKISSLSEEPKSMEDSDETDKAMCTATSTRSAHTYAPTTASLSDVDSETEYWKLPLTPEHHHKQEELEDEHHEDSSTESANTSPPQQHQEPASPPTQHFMATPRTTAHKSLIQNQLTHLPSQLPHPPSALQPPPEFRPGAAHHISYISTYHTALNKIYEVKQPEWTHDYHTRGWSPTGEPMVVAPTPPPAAGLYPYPYSMNGMYHPFGYGYGWYGWYGCGYGYGNGNGNGNGNGYYHG